VTTEISSERRGIKRAGAAMKIENGRLRARDWAGGEEDGKVKGDRKRAADG